jgi:hypothetical protein
LGHAVLHGVLRTRSVPEHGLGDAQEPRQVPLHQLTEGRGIPPPGRQDQLEVVLSRRAHAL